LIPTLFVKCTHKEDREDIDNSLINFSVDHLDNILNHFSATFLLFFKEVTNKDSDAKTEKRKKMKKQKKEEEKGKKKEQYEKAIKDRIKN
jgi:hypothetical protein